MVADAQHQKQSMLEGMVQNLVENQPLSNSKDGQQGLEHGKDGQDMLDDIPFQVFWLPTCIPWFCCEILWVVNHSTIDPPFPARTRGIQRNMKQLPCLYYVDMHSTAELSDEDSNTRWNTSPWMLGYVCLTWCMSS